MKAALVSLTSVAISDAHSAHSKSVFQAVVKSILKCYPARLAIGFLTSRVGLICSGLALAVSAVAIVVFDQSRKKTYKQSTLRITLPPEEKLSARPLPKNEIAKDRRQAPQILVERGQSAAQLGQSIGEGTVILPVKKQIDAVAAGVEAAGGTRAYAKHIGDRWLGDRWLPIGNTIAMYAIMTTLYVSFFVIKLFYVPQALPLESQGEKKD